MIRIDCYHHFDEDFAGLFVKIIESLGELHTKVDNMADNEAAALAELSDEINLMFTKLDELTAALQAATGVDHSADISALKDRIAAKLAPPAAPADPAAPPA